MYHSQRCLELLILLPLFQTAGVWMCSIVLGLKVLVRSWSPQWFLSKRPRVPILHQALSSPVLFRKPSWLLGKLIDSDRRAGEASRMGVSANREHWLSNLPPTTVFVLFGFCVCVCDKVLCSPGGTQTHCVAENELELLILLPSPLKC